ncbi:MAG TPA: hypothetical protein VKF63_12645, partial [Terracidiphilus sp.]|nr:hypothetical protein [Terracidiphilus sp.]
KKASKSVIENLHRMLTYRSWGILLRSIFGGSHKIPFSRKLFSRAVNVAKSTRALAPEVCFSEKVASGVVALGMGHQYPERSQNHVA